MINYSINLTTIATETAQLFIELGAIDGQARERGYPNLMDCSKFVLATFEKHKGELELLRSGLNGVYLRIKKIDTYCSSDENPFHVQVKLLYERWGALSNTLRTFDGVLSSHILIDELVTAVAAMQDELAKVNEVGLEKWESLSDELADLFLRVKIVFPDSHQGRGDFCQKHYEEKLEITQILRVCELDLSAKHEEFRKRCLADCHGILERLVPLLERGGSKEDVQKLYALLPLELRVFVYRASIPQDDVQALFSPLNRNFARDAWAEIRGTSFFDSERDLKTFKEQCHEVKKTRASIREEARKKLDTLSCQSPEESELLLRALREAMAEDPRYNLKDPSIELFQARLRHIPVLTSLNDLKSQIEGFKEARMFDSAQREQLVAALLNAAEKKVALGGVFALCGGKENAPKDLDRLLAAFDQVAPAIKIEVVPPPAASRVLGVKRTIEQHQRRQSSPAPLMVNKERPLEPLKIAVQSVPLPAPAIETPQPPKIAEKSVPLPAPAIEAPQSPKIVVKSVPLPAPAIETPQSPKIVVKSVPLPAPEVKIETPRTVVVPVPVIREERPVEVASPAPALPLPKVLVTVNYAPKDGKMFICGTGPGMSWDAKKKVELKNVNGKYVFEYPGEYDLFEFKILLSDNKWSKGKDNFKLEKGKTLTVTPSF